MLTFRDPTTLLQTRENGGGPARAVRRKEQSMKRALSAALTAVAVAAVTFAASATAQAPAPPAWPPGTSQVFIWADTVTTAGKQTNFFGRSSSVVFRAYAVDLKTKKVLTATDALFFYVKIPGQPNVKMTYGPAGKAMLWTGTWAIPADYPYGVVNFKVLVKTKTKRYGAFTQAPVDAANLTVTATP
jgi:hypothetical protein